MAPLHTLQFFKEFMVSPKHVGAVAPSSKYLAGRVVEMARVEEASIVVEWGPGTGAITQCVLEKLPSDAQFFAMEISEDFVRTLAARFPQVVVHPDSAANTRKYLERIGAQSCDSIVSGLPWASFNDALQDQLLDTLLDVLRPGGRFVTYTYIMSPLMPAGQKFRAKLKRRFSHFEVTPMVWRNIPPAFVYLAVK